MNKSFRIFILVFLIMICVNILLKTCLVEPFANDSVSGIYQYLVNNDITKMINNITTPSASIDLINALNINLSDNLFSPSALIYNLKSNIGTIDDLTTKKITLTDDGLITNLKSAKGTIDDLTTTNIKSSTGTIDTLNTKNINLLNNGLITNLKSAKGTIDDLTTNNLLFGANG